MKIVKNICAILFFIGLSMGVIACFAGVDELGFFEPAQTLGLIGFGIAIVCGGIVVLLEESEMRAKKLSEFYSIDERVKLIKQKSAHCNDAQEGESRFLALPVPNRMLQQAAVKQEDPFAITASGRDNRAK